MSPADALLRCDRIPSPRSLRRGRMRRRRKCPPGSAAARVGRWPAFDWRPGRGVPRPTVYRRTLSDCQNREETTKKSAALRRDLHGDPGIRLASLPGPASRRQGFFLFRNRWTDSAPPVWKMPRRGRPVPVAHRIGVAGGTQSRVGADKAAAHRVASFPWRCRLLPHVQPGGSSQGTNLGRARW